MTDRFETYDQYLSVCKLHKKDVNKLITIVFEAQSQIEPRSRKDLLDLSSYLNLRGNNYFLNKEKVKK